MPKHNEVSLMGSRFSQVCLESFMVRSWGSAVCNASTLTPGVPHLQDEAVVGNSWITVFSATLKKPATDYRRHVKS